MESLKITKVRRPTVIFALEFIGRNRRFFGQVTKCIINKSGNFRTGDAASYGSSNDVFLANRWIWNGRILGFS
jgi:hypothetical protein